MQKLYSLFSIAHCDLPERWQMGPQDPATPVMEGMIFFHNYIMFFLILIGILVFYMLAKILYSFNERKNPIPKKFVHSSKLEIIWTLLPAALLLMIAVPSFSLLYSLDELVDPSVTIKVIGHQWYWTYECSDFATRMKGRYVSYDSYMVSAKGLIYRVWVDGRPRTRYGQPRLLEVDYRLVLPVKTHIRVLVTSADVIHSWAVPSFGIKIDATPGRLTQGTLFIKRVGTYCGQCSELCGVNHAFMPIVVNAVTQAHFYEHIAGRSFTPSHSKVYSWFGKK